MSRHLYSDRSFPGLTEHNRFEDGYDESAQETIRPSRQNRSDARSLSIFESFTFPQNPLTTQQAPLQNFQHGIPSPTSPDDFPQSRAAMGLQQPRSLEAEDSAAAALGPAEAHELLNLALYNQNFLMANMAKYQTGGGALGPPQNLFNGSDMLPTHELCDASDAFNSDFDFWVPERTPESIDSSRMNSPQHRRSQSAASIESAQSIAALDIEESKTDTGVTLEEISQYIKGPDALDNRWTCVFPECGKKFGRKENIKSHVQTHLNDRQYQCPTCHKCFVRQHDLKRHAKIHTGVKPYPCDCGNSFARHDALTRHRQRGMCIGAFDGAVRKVAKRGRPRKHRPEMEDRKTKSAKTREKNMSISSTSSFASSSTIGTPEADHNQLPIIRDWDMSSSSPMVSYHQNDILPELELTDLDAAAYSMATPESTPPDMGASSPSDCFVSPYEVMGSPYTASSPYGYTI